MTDKIPQEILIKQLLYRSSHRGCKETDFLIGKFFTEKFAEFDESDLQIYQRFIEEDDLLIYDWILGKVKVPDEYSKLIFDLRKFHKI